MDSMSEYLKKYESKNKKKDKKIKKESLTIIDDSKAIVIPKQKIPLLDNVDIIGNNEDEESIGDDKPTIFLEDGITTISKDMLLKISSTQNKWMPINNNEEKTIVNKRHDSDSDEEIEDRRPTAQVSVMQSPLRNEKVNKNDKSLYKTIDIKHERILGSPTCENVKSIEKNDIPEIKWGMGSYEEKEKLKNMIDLTYEMSKPLARYKDDADLENHLKSIVYAEDPLKDFISKPDINEQIPQKIFKTPQRISQNRFNIPSGKKWDGIDRSNGFERKRIDRIREISNQEQEAFMFFSEDI